MQTVDLCVCTYRRESIVDTLRSIARLDRSCVVFRVIVADNDVTPSAEERVKRAAAELDLHLLYVHAPARNISIARNACLNAATAPLVAFIDDDLIASEPWLCELVRKMEATGADIVFGPVQAAYPAAAPAWARAADMHSTLPVVLPDGRIVTGYTCNVLMRRNTIGDMRFDPALGRSGGEDTMFFDTLVREGARCAYAEGALAHEDVVENRINLNWLLKRSFRAGQTHARILRQNHAQPAKQIPILVAKSAFCLGSAALTVWSPPRWRRALVRGALHAGALSSMLGMRDLELY